jgi:predicted component of type VI protein secretion system
VPAGIERCPSRVLAEQRCYSKEPFRRPSPVATFPQGQGHILELSIDERQDPLAAVAVVELPEDRDSSFELLDKRCVELIVAGWRWQACGNRNHSPLGCEGW